MSVFVGADLHVPWVDQTLPLNAGFVLREDVALETHLAGILVREMNSKQIPGKPGFKRVPVYFQHAEPELKTRVFPNVIIYPLRIERDPTREHRGKAMFQPEYRPPGIPVGSVTDMPIPMKFVYQVSAFARSYQAHREIMAQLFVLLPPRFGAVNMVAARGSIDDRSIRRMDVSGPTERDFVDGDTKRVFSSIYTVEISSELFEGEVLHAGQVRTIVLDPPSEAGYSGLVSTPTPLEP